MTLSPVLTKTDRQHWHSSGVGLASPVHYPLFGLHWLLRKIIFFLAAKCFSMFNSHLPTLYVCHLVLGSWQWDFEFFPWKYLPGMVGNAITEKLWDMKPKYFPGWCWKSLGKLQSQVMNVCGFIKATPVALYFITSPSIDITLNNIQINFLGCSQLKRCQAQPVNLFYYSL